ncbi:Asp-tRNA(Asn)/Glu-tRNA(Gln) amidotransferase A subunit family amidase [Litorivivens lipolytica]|uniref:Asp-tRNA(Asn)/Glu-tRNA(Gln) amidotransferase A subunit family amidase n=1 Tax=Litorivivens lipolytica TaxID=1524264 RepID=A0A7W4W3N0_9GAMM|nr:amidase [Litorivivens lipolytica]MBB3046852.1 Asp-tRNA(Asn)/Glu-tRNA(Gln) amidotransferase A subunit family amidase [Litorivivens lipolytica]
MAYLVRTGQVTPTDLLNEALQRTRQWTPLLNAIVMEHTEFARREIAGGVSGPLAGVPFLLKDLNTYLEGTVTTEGSRFFAEAVAARDSYLVERYRRAGLVIFGKTATPEFGKNTTTETLLWGETRNPWNPDYIVGGSSGGSAAAVAAGILPVAHGNDGGGSLRIPASVCGLFGLKPSRFRTPLGPAGGDGNGMSTQHVMSRSVRDSALLLDVSRGPEPGGYGSIRAPERPYFEEVGRAPGKLRIGLMKTPVIDVPVDPECIVALEKTARLCESLGHHVEEVELPINGMEAYLAAGKLLSLSSNLAIQAREKVLGRKVTEQDIEPINWVRYHQYKKVSGEEVLAARSLQVKVHWQMAEFMKNYDVILSPTLPVLPAKIGQMGPKQPMKQVEQLASMYSLFTLLYNFTGQPAMSVPLHWSANGLPVGVQFAGRYADEDVLLRLAAQLEQAAPWKDRRPVLPV